MQSDCNFSALGLHFYFLFFYFCNINKTDPFCYTILATKLKNRKTTFIYNLEPYFTVLRLRQSFF